MTLSAGTYSAGDDFLLQIIYRLIDFYYNSRSLTLFVRFLIKWQGEVMGECDGKEAFDPQRVKIGKCTATKRTH